MTDVVLALDLGTGGGKAALVDADARVVRSTFVPYPTSYPAPGRHEQRPEDWWAAVVRSCRDLLDADAGRHRVTAVGLSGHSLAMVPVGADGSALLDSVPIWSDTRGEAARPPTSPPVVRTSGTRRPATGSRAACTRCSRPAGCAPSTRTSPRAPPGCWAARTG